MTKNEKKSPIKIFQSGNLVEKMTTNAPRESVKFCKTSSLKGRPIHHVWENPRGKSLLRNLVEIPIRNQKSRMSKSEIPLENEKSRTLYVEVIAMELNAECILMIE